MLVLGVSVRRSDLLEPSTDPCAAEGGRGRLGCGGIRLGDVGYGVEGPVVLPDGPDAKSVGGAPLGGEQDGACAVDEECAQVDVSSLGDRSESTPKCG